MQNKWPYSSRGKTGQMMVIQNKFVINIFFISNNLGSPDLNRRKGKMNMSDTLHIPIKDTCT